MNGIIEHLGNKPMATLSIHRHEKSRFPLLLPLATSCESESELFVVRLLQ